MIAVASLLVVVALSLLVVRIGEVALTMTGLSQEVASFQALSAFSGTGFTTAEAEKIVAHPERRRVVTLLIRLGSVGLVTAISSLMLSFIGAGEAAPRRLAVLFGGALGLFALARSRAFNRMLTPLIERTLARRATLELRDYAELLHLRRDYRIAEFDVEEGGWFAGRTLRELDLPKEGVLVLGVSRTSGEYLGAPPADSRLEGGDRLLLYGRDRRLRELSHRHSGDEAAHDAARAQHERDMEEQEAREADARGRRP